MSEYRIPLWSRSGIAGYALVDAEDYEALNQHRWMVNTKGYATRSVHVRRAAKVYSSRQIRMHRQILGLEHGDKRQVDHVNLDKLDNRRSNLRVVTNAQNHQNMPVRRDSSSGVRGVSRYSSRDQWRAVGHLNGRIYSLGYHDTIEAAERVVKAWRAENMPFSEEARTT